MGVIKMKSRVLYFSSNGKMKKLAAILGAKMGTKEDVVPPAYSCDKEKVLFLGVSAKANMSDTFTRFCDGLNLTKAANVAVFAEGKPEAVKAIMDRIAAAGANVCQPAYECKFKLFGGISAEDQKAIEAWCDSIVASIQ